MLREHSKAILRSIPNNGHPKSEAMPKTVEAVVDQDGHIRLPDSISLKRGRRVLVTILEDEGERASDPQVAEAALLSEESLSEDWTRNEEKEAWKHLQPFSRIRSPGSISLFGSVGVKTSSGGGPGRDQS